MFSILNQVANHQYEEHKKTLIEIRKPSTFVTFLNNKEDFLLKLKQSK